MIDIRASLSNFNALSNNLFKSGFYKIEFPKVKDEQAYRNEEGQGTLYFETFRIDLQDPQKMIEVAKKIAIQGIFQKFQRWVLSKISESSLLCQRAVNWADNKLASMGKERLLELFPTGNKFDLQYETLELPEKGIKKAVDCIVFRINGTEKFDNAEYKPVGHYARCFDAQGEPRAIVFRHQYADAFLRDRTS